MSCTICPSGTESSAQTNNECVCQINHYVPLVGTCVACPEGSTSTGGNKPNILSTCVLEAGYYVDNVGDVRSMSGNYSQKQLVFKHFIDIVKKL